MRAGDENAGRAVAVIEDRVRVILSRDIALIAVRID